jgi:hypothetical protein
MHMHQRLSYVDASSELCTLSTVDLVSIGNAAVQELDFCIANASCFVRSITSTYALRNRPSACHGAY